MSAHEPLFQFRAFVKDEHTGECRWFVYVEGPGGTSSACRFNSRGRAELIASTMNEAWRKEGRLYAPTFAE
jgi:hypothetical protein